MIIWDLDGTLADCEHRRHFVNYVKWIGNQEIGSDLSKWKPDWKSFYEACDKDEPIKPTIEIMLNISINYGPIQIWSGRCESVRQKTVTWLIDNLKAGIDEVEYFNSILKMRPIGDNTPDDELKEKWLDEELSKGETIDFVFDDRKKVRDMWIRRGIFVFDVSQGKGDF